MPQLAAIYMGAKALGVGEKGVPGDNDYHAYNFSEGKDYDPNASAYGGDAGHWEPTGEMESITLPNGQVVSKPKQRWVPSSFQQDKARYELGAQWADSRGGPRLDEDAYGLARSAAHGEQPSQAEILAQKANQGAIANGYSMAASARGGAGARVAALRNAQTLAVKQAAEGNRDVAALRAKEMEGARGQYLGAAGENLTAEGQQRQRNDARAMGYEGMRQDAEKTQLDAKMREQEMLAGTQKSRDTLEAERSKGNADNSAGWAKTLISMGGSAASGATSGAASSGSDANMKEGFMPLGSLSGLFDGNAKMKQYYSDADPTYVMNGSGMDVGATGAKMSNATPWMASDEKSKDAAYQAGLAIGKKLTAKSGAVTAEKAKRMAAEADAKKKADEANLARGPAVGGTPPGPQAPSVPGQIPQGIEDQVAKDRKELGSPVRYGYIEEGDSAKGVAGAPRGYANARAGQPGAYNAVAGKEPEPVAPEKPVTPTYGGGWEQTASIDTGRGDAPGTEDFYRSGAGRETTASDAKAKEAAYQQGRQDERSKAPAPAPAEPSKAVAGSAASRIRKNTERIILQAPTPRVDYRTDAERAADTAHVEVERHQKLHEEESKKAALARASMQPKVPPPPGRLQAMGDKVSDSVATNAADGFSRLTGDHSADAQLQYGNGPAGVKAALNPGLPVGDKQVRGVPADQFTTSDKRAKEVLHHEEPMADANRSMEPTAYRYKPQFTPPGQKQGEVNVGPIANEMERDPVAKTAIVHRPEDGLLAIDKEKGLKLVMGGLASLQHQVDAIATGVSAKKKRSA